MKSKKAIAKEAMDNIKKSTRRLSKQYKNTKECQGFYAGDFMDYKDTIQFKTPQGAKKKAMVQFNKVKPYVNAVKGFMAQNRRDADYTAKIESPLIRKQYTDHANYLKDYMRDNNNAAQIETQQDGDLLIAGYGAVETVMSYGEGFATTDPNGEVLCQRLDPLKVGWDHNAIAPNLIDRKYCWYEQEYDLDEALDLFGDAKEEDFEQITPDDVSPDDYSYFPRGGVYDKITEVDWADKDENRVRVYFYHWYDVEKFYRAENPLSSLSDPLAIELAVNKLQTIAQSIPDEDQTGLFTFNPDDEVLTFDAKIKSQLEDLFEEFIEIHEYPKKVYYSAVVSGDKCFSAFPAICQQDMPIQFKTGDYDAKNKIWTGMVNSMKEPALYYNKMLTELLFVIASNSKGGVMIEEGSVHDIRKFEKQYAKTDAVVEVAKDAISGNKIKAKATPFSPTGYESLIELADKQYNEVNGVDKAFLGSSEMKDENGVLHRQRIRQVTAVLANFFDSVVLFQKMNARLYLDLMRVYAENNAGALFRILGPDGKDDFVRVSQDRLAAEFLVSVKEAPTAPDEKQQQARFLFDFAQSLISINDAAAAKSVYAIGLKYSNLDADDIDKITAELQKQPPQISPEYVKQLEEELNIYKSEFSKVELQKNLKQIEDMTTDIEKTKADIESTKVKTLHELEKSRQTSAENTLIESGKPTVNVNI